MANVRNNFRVSLQNHMRGTTSLQGLEVCVTDLSAGSMGFQSTEVLELGKVFSITIEALDVKIVMVGEIARRTSSDGVMHYGFKSMLDDTEKTPWVKLINEMAIIQRKNPGKMKFAACQCEKAETQTP
jgi:hypothetical protein